MKLRIPRRIKAETPIEEDSEQSDDSEDKDNVPVTTTKTSTTFVNDGGFNSGMSGISGVPTRTTSTLTPTTLRNIEQTFQDLTNDLSQSGPYSAGFVPPPAPTNHQQNQLTVLTNNTLPPYQPPMRQQQQQQQQHHQQAAMIPSFLNDVEQNSMESMDSSSMSDSGSWQTPPPTVMDDMHGTKRPRSSYASPGSSSSNSNPKPARRNAGGRKPNKAHNISPEEEEKRRVRRERNKQAAARCRRRREDHTSELQGQVDELEDKKRQFTTEIQTMNSLRDELFQLIEEHKKLNHCVIGDRQTPPDVKPNVVQNGKITMNVPSTITASAVPLQRPNNFVTAITSNNNNNNNTMNANKLALKIKAEPLDELYDDDEPPRKRRCDMVSGQEFDITTPTTPYMPQLNTPTFMKNQKPNRPSSLNVPANLKPSDFLARRNVSDIAGISVNTPSSGMFNFDSLMEGGTGLTPVNPCIQVPCSTQNRNPMDMLQTPTSEPSKLCSL